MLLRLLVNATVQRSEETLKPHAVSPVIFKGNKLQPTSIKSIKFLNMKAQRAELEVHSAIGSKISLVSKVCNTGFSSLPPVLENCTNVFSDIDIL